MKTFYLVCILFLKCNAINKGKSILRTLGGKAASIEDYPYVVRLQVRVNKINKASYYVHICSGTTLTPKWTVTAAHCIQGYSIYIDISGKETHNKNKTSEGVIKYGNVNSLGNDTSGFSQILQYVMHPGYRSLKHQGYVHNDIGLLSTNPIQLSKYGSISYIDYSALSGEEAFALGFGRSIKVDRRSVTLTLLKPLQIFKIMMKTCDNSNSEGQHMYPVLCIVGLCGETTKLCIGDSGGPVLHASGVIGVNSMAEDLDCDPSSTKGTSGAYFNAISPYVEWIKETIRGH